LPTRQELDEYAKAINAKAVESAESKAKAPGRTTYGPQGPILSSLALGTTRHESEAQTVGFKSRLIGEFFVGSSVHKASLLTAESILLPGARGVVTGMTRIDPKQFFRLPLDADILLQPGQYAETGFVAAQDANLYAIHIDSGRILWRFTDGTPFAQPPAANDHGVFLATERKGMYCVDRENGDLKWRNADAGRFIASNSKFVYAADRSNRFLVLDRERGTTLSTFDMRDFVFPITNDRTDRVYLGAHNGLLISLHDRDFEKPLLLKKEAKPAAPPGGEKPADKPRENGKPKDTGDAGKPKDSDEKPKDKNDKN
jgi:hypothetical protein